MLDEPSRRPHEYKYNQLNHHVYPTLFIVLFVLILVHEWGHFIVAKKTGMRVDEFGIGFPPKLFGIKRGETEYTFNLLPIGGFVKILGENGVDGETLSETDRARAFSARPRFAQALVLVAGVAMNILFAWFLFVLVL
ncbi:MAG: site-2 protease family protein [Candidatus Paceibacterota bacterium]